MRTRCASAVLVCLFLVSSAAAQAIDVASDKPTPRITPSSSATARQRVTRAYDRLQQALKNARTADDEAEKARTARALAAARKAYDDARRAMGAAVGAELGTNAAKNLGTAQKNLLALRREYEQAKQAYDKAKTDEDKAKTRKTLAEIQAKLGESQKALTALMALARRPTSTRSFLGARALVREVDDRDDPVERFLLLTPDRPIVVEVSMMLDGKPFRTAREELIDEMMNLVKTDDGEVRWSNALKNGRFTFGRVRVTTSSSVQSYINMFDRNRNGLAERSEVRRFAASFFQPAFSLGGTASPVLNRSFVRYAGAGNESPRVDLMKLLDTDEDGELSQAEIAKAGERLQSRDADGNDLLYAAEINGNQNPTLRRVVTAYRPATPSGIAQLLGPTLNASLIHEALRKEYAGSASDLDADAFVSAPELFASLDTNGDGVLQPFELVELNNVDPDVRLELSMGGRGKRGWTSVFVSDRLGEGKLVGDKVTISLPNMELSFSADTRPAPTPDYSRVATGYLSRFDGDNNGYLDKKELSGAYARMMEMWDADGDGKVFPKEIEAGYVRTLKPQMGQIQMGAEKMGNALFQSVDVSGDGRLSLREMRNANRQINGFDADGDSRVTTDEIPISILVKFSRGNPTGAYPVAVRRRSTPNRSRPTRSNAPEWFQRMDRNGDGDVTLKEFLGDEDTFRKMDTNKDGFLEAKEARAANSETSSDTD